MIRIVAALFMTLTLALTANFVVIPVQAGTSQTYLVLFKGNSVAKDAIAAAGGSLVVSYDKIGVAVVRSSSASFAATIRADSRIAGAAATAGFATQPDKDTADNGPLPDSAPATDSDSLSGLQWDMMQMHTPEAHKITGGSPSVVVGDIDTGLDYTHPDLKANVDFSRSASCVGGVANTSPAAWMDDNGHGTHTAGTIAAASNGIGIKAGNADGYFIPEAVVCSFMWAADHGIAVTNNSYFADPWLFNCKNDPDQRAIWNAECRAISYAISKGVTVVAAEGNQADDLAHPTQDATSPDDSNPVLREIHNNCAVVPVEVAGVIGVTASGNKLQKSYYSSYGSGMVQVIAPGGDSILQKTAAAPNGRVLSTWPASLASTCARKLSEGGALYCYAQGTSMASPHVAGLAALIVSQGTRSPGAVAAKINNTADPIACPSDVSIYAFYPALDNGAPQVCTGGTGYNSFNGHGQVNALTAVSK